LSKQLGGGFNPQPPPAIQTLAIAGVLHNSGLLIKLTLKLIAVKAKAINSSSKEKLANIGVILDQDKNINGPILLLLGNIYYMGLD
jgi:hypothetical protein